MPNMKDFVIENGVLEEYKGRDSNVVIPDSVTRIGYGAFRRTYSLTSVTIPDSVISIGDYAFEECWDMTSVTIPDSVTSIGKNAFCSCRSLNTVYAQSLQGWLSIQFTDYHSNPCSNVGDLYFGGELGANITIPDNVTSISKMAFLGCRSLTSVTIPDSVTSIGEMAFSGCTNLTSITVPDSVTSIGENAFFSCRRLTSVTIPDSVTSIGESAFSGCTSLTSITIPDSVTSISESAFSGCTSLTTVTIPDSVAGIGRKAFNGCSNLTNVTIPDSVTNIGNGAFYDCRSLTSVTIPDRVTNIGNGAFYGCSSLTSVKIPDGVASISWGVFYNCSSLTSITIPDSVTGIGDNAFKGCCSLTSVTIPDSVTSIGDEAFGNCSNLTSVAIPKGMTSIVEKAFSGCKSLTSVIIPNSVTSIGEKAFSGCRSLTSITIPGSVTSIGESAFSGCRSLTSVTVPSSVTSVGDYAFTGCEQLKSVSFERIPKYLEKDIFKSCSDELVLSFPEGAFGSLDPAPTELAKYHLKISAKDKACLWIGQKAKTWRPAAAQLCKGEEKVVFDQLLVLLESSKKADAPSAEFMELFIMKLNPVQVQRAVEILQKHKYKNMQQLMDNETVKMMLAGESVDENPIEAFARECLDKKPISNDIMAIVGKGIHYADSKTLCSREVLAMIIQAYKRGDSNTEFNKRDRLDQYVNPDAEKVAAALDPKELSSFALSLINNGKLHYREYMHVWGRFARGADIAAETHDIDSKNDPRWRTPNIIEALLLNDSTEALIFECKVCNLEKYARMRGKTTIAVRDEVLNALCPQEEIRSLVTAYEENDQQAICEAEKIISSLDRDTLSEALTKLVEETGYNLGCEAWVRYAGEESIRSACERHIHMTKGKAECDALGQRFYNKLINSNTRAAMQTFEKYGELERYARAHGMTAMEVRDTMMLPAFAFDPDGVKRYDIGGNTIEVSIAPDLSFRLFDVNQQKVIRSFPKKSDDPAKAEAAAKDFAAFKKEVLSFAKERSKLLHRMHITGDYVNADLWRKVYIEHPVIRHLAQLVVWQDEAGKTFMIVNGETVDAQDKAYVPQGRIRVAHVVEMKAADIDAWRKWLTKQSRVQLFEQVWEPVITWNSDTLQSRYNGASLTNAERNALKNALSKRGVFMRADDMDCEFNHRAGEWVFSNKGKMFFGDCIWIDYKVDKDTKDITFGKASASVKPSSREMNTVLLELDRITLLKQISSDHDSALTAETLSEFSAAQITDFINLAIDSKATRCTAVLLSYKNEHFAEYADMNEFTLDW